MKDKAEMLETSTSLAMETPAEVDAGADIALKVRISCSPSSDLRGSIVRIIASEAVLKEVKVATFSVGGVDKPGDNQVDEPANETTEFIVKAPNEPGDYTWTAVFPAQEKAGIQFGESSSSFSFAVKSHVTSMAVWDAPFPVIMGSTYGLKVGVQCCANCRLTGTKIEILDHEGKNMATGTLGDEPLSDTNALYWTELQLEAPDSEGPFAWEVRFPKPDLELPHEGVVSAFAFRTAKPPDHTLTVKVIDNTTKAPIKDAQVILFPYRCFTDDAGMAKISLPKGEYELIVLLADYRQLETKLVVDSDSELLAELSYWPEDVP